MSEQDIQKLITDHAALQNENAVLKDELAYAQEQLNWLKKQMFGQKSEQTSSIMDCGEQLSMLSEETEQSKTELSQSVTVPEHKRKKKRSHDDWMQSLFIEEKYYELKDPVCEKCGAEMKNIGKETAYDELVYTPAKFHIRRHIVNKYKCPSCGETPENDKNYDDVEKCNIIRAKYPKPMIPGSYCSAELLAHIIYEKYGKAVPLHRQEKDFKSKGIPLLKATMSNWVCCAAEKWCLPIVEKMHEKLVTGDIIHADETVLQVLHEKGRKATTDSRMWVYCNGKNINKNISVFEYQPTRSGEHPARFLKEFNGYLICDGYDAYNAVAGVKRCGCLAHARRKFVEAMPSDKELQKTSVAAKAVEFFNKIYHEESLMAEMSAEERYKQRLVKVKPLLEAFFAWLDKLPVNGKGKLAIAIGYALNEKSYLLKFLEDGNIPVDNNRAENAIRPLTLGRKNWLFSNTANGAKSSAVLYSIISTAQSNGLDAEKYLTDLFSKPMGTILLPWEV